MLRCDKQSGASPRLPYQSTIPLFRTEQSMPVRAPHHARGHRETGYVRLHIAHWYIPLKISLHLLVAVCLLLAMASAAYTDTPAYSTAVGSRLTISSDLTAIQDTTVRQTVLKESAIRIL